MGRPGIAADVAGIERLRRDLIAGRFTGDALEERLGREAAEALHRGQRVPATRRMTTTDPLDTIARFFVLGRSVASDDLEAAFPTLGVTGLVGMGLARVDGSGVQPLVDLRPYSFVDASGVGSWWIASDLGEMVLGRALPEDHVLGVGGASTTLTSLMIQRPVGTALDLGTGSGIQALHASRHAARVVATDISARALDLARFNAELNGVHNIEFRRGSLFEPVRGERFDHIVSNPPFVITPAVGDVPAYEYRAGALVGDALVEQVVRGASEHLAEGGIAQLLGNWEYRGVQDGLDRAAAWADSATPVDSWVVEREVQDPALYAETWIRDGGTRPGERFDELYGLWLDDFEQRGVTAIGFGYVTLRRDARSARSGRIPLRRAERLPGALGHNATGLGEHLRTSLAAHDWQADRDDEALLTARLVVAGDVTEERHYWPGAEHPTVMTLHQGSGFGRSVPLDTPLAGLVGVCDGELAVASIIAALSDLLEQDASALQARLLPAVRELLVSGFLSPLADD